MVVAPAATGSRTSVEGMDNRHEVQDFLTGLRGRITPEVAGITAFGGERRVPGLRREEVAQLAGVSTAYYTRMERGDLGGVSESVLYALVNALQLNEAETQHLFDLARNATGVGRPSRTKPATRLSPQLEQLLDTMRDVPVVALSRLGDPMGSNSLGRALFLHLFPEGTTPLNTARYLFLDPRSQEFYPTGMWSRANPCPRCDSSPVRTPATGNSPPSSENSRPEAASSARGGEATPYAPTPPASSALPIPSSARWRSPIRRWLFRPRRRSDWRHTWPRGAPPPPTPSIFSAAGLPPLPPPRRNRVRPEPP